MLNKNFSFIITLSNLLFYIGIIITIFLCDLQDNSPIFLVGYVCIIMGLIGTALTDSVINSDAEGINITAFQIILLLKEAILIVIFVVMRKNFNVSLCILFGLSITDNVLEIILIKQIYRKQISVKQFLMQENQVDRITLSKIRRSYWINIIFIFLFCDIHNNIYETMTMLILALLVHMITVRKTIICICDYTGLQRKSLNHIIAIFWFIELIGLAMVYLDVDRILICSIFGYYYMIITDCVNPQRTSIIKIDRNKKREEHHEENTIQ